MNELNEKALVEQLLRIINSNYSDFYAIDIPDDKVYSFEFNVANALKIKGVITYTDFIDKETKRIKAEEVDEYFNGLSLTKLEGLYSQGIHESKVKYRRLCETGEYRWYQNIINYLPFENRKLIFMMSEDINDRLTDMEEHTLKLEKQVGEYRTALQEERDQIGNAILQVNNTLAAQGNGGFELNNTRDYINSVFNKVSVDNPELNKVLSTKIAQTSNSMKKCILIVDDSAVIRNSLKRIFVDNYEIVMAKNGEEAISIINKNILSDNFNDDRLNIVGILLDLIMPGKDGFDVLNYLKQYRLLNKVPVAIISGDETIETRKKVYSYDIVDMLEKPFNTENIKKRISKIISLYETGNTLQSMVTNQAKELKENKSSSSELDVVISNIVKNIHNSETSRKITNYTLAITNELKVTIPSLNIDETFVKAITNTCYLYNIGSIAMDNTRALTKEFVQEEIKFGLDIIKAILVEPNELKIASNIIKYSCETYNGRGLPDGLQGVDIPIEAAIVSMAVRLVSDKRPARDVAYSVIEEESSRYNPNVLKALNTIKDKLD
ncbi:MAG: response regulator [Bacilli bacterium]|nr:response regulator [Bacilli bacterium]